MGFGHQVFPGEFSGAIFNENGEGFMHMASVVCPGVLDIIEGIQGAHGYCTVTDNDGESAYLQWQCRGKVVCLGGQKWIGSTGTNMRGLRETSR